MKNQANQRIMTKFLFALLVLVCGIIVHVNKDVKVNASSVNDSQYDFKYSPTMNSKMNQNFHYNTPQGFSSDIQSIVPKYGKNNKVKYWEVYYLQAPYPNNTRFANQWYGVKTTDFVKFTPLVNSKNPTSKQNVAIPDAAYKNKNGVSVSVDKNNKNAIPWNYVATGAVISNNGLKNKALLKKDKWGHSIKRNAELAYFSTFTGNGQGGIYLAYRNNQNQFHPYSSKPVLTNNIVGKQVSTDFRDPYVTTNGKQLIMYVAGGVNSKMFVLTSSDGIHWKYNSNNDIALSGLVETPNIQTINGKTFMIYSAQESLGNKQGFTKYVQGYLDKNGIFKKTGAVNNLDDGTDLYAGNYERIDKDNVVGIGWLGNWIYTPIVWDSSKFPDMLHSGTFTMSRILQRSGSKLVSIPVEPGKSILKHYYKVKSTRSKFKVESSRKVEIDYSSNSNKTINLVRNSHNSININFANNYMTVTRKEDQSVPNGMNTTTSTGLNSSKIKRVILYVDNSSVEIYLPEIKKMFTVQDFPNESGNQRYLLSTNKGSKINVYSFKGLVNKSYVKSELNTIQSKAKRKLHRKGSNRAKAYKALSNVKIAKKYIAKANKSRNDAKSNVYLAISNYYLSNAKYFLNN